MHRSANTTTKEKKLNTTEEFLAASEFDREFARRKGFPTNLLKNSEDPGYQTAKWAWDYQQRTIDQLRGQTNAIRRALYDIGVGS